jgi:uncharacterized protein (DUF433 family)
MEHHVSHMNGDEDPRNIPAYTMAEAARYLRMAPATLRSWVVGRSYPRGEEVAFFEPLIQPPNSSSTHLSFWNLIEAHVLLALRIEHGVSIKAVRIARDAAQRTYGINRLLLNQELSTDAGDLFLDKYGQLLNLSKSGQLAMKKILHAYLKRVDWDPWKFPLRLFPFPHKASIDAPKIIVIDPFISFGRPVIRNKNISTATIADRIDAGESIKDLARDYDLKESEIDDAIIYERAA